MRSVRMLYPIVLVLLVYPNGPGSQDSRQEPSAAIEALLRSAKQGDPAAQVSLASMYIQGIGVPQNYAEATKWLREASERGNRVAQGLLGSLYAEGLGVTRDYVEAYKWLTLSAASLDMQNPFFRRATDLRDSLVQKMNAQEIAESERRATEWASLHMPNSVAKDGSVPGSRLTGAIEPASPELAKREESPTFSVNVNVVNVFVTVRDKKGGLVKDLSREDFTIKEDGRTQSLQYFARESDLPLTIGLIVDTTPSEANMLEEERKASRIFFDNILRPGIDRAFLIQYSDNIELLQYVTSSRGELDRSLNLLRSHSSGIPPGTVLADAIYHTCEEIMKRQEGRKALILLGDGGHLGSRIRKAIDAAQMADTLIYGIFIYDMGFRGVGGIGYDRTQDRLNLRWLSEETGGAYFEVTNKATLGQIYATIEEELRGQYNLGYVPDTMARNGYRKIRVGVQKKGLTVYSRRGYFPSTSQRKAESPGW
jgi:VWFA-related protein